MDSIKHFLSAIWDAWKKFGHWMGEIVGRAFLMIFYLTIALPFGLGVRMLGDPLDVKRRDKQPAWIERESPEATMEAAHQQF
jgi:hypothetical protein